MATATERKPIGEAGDAIGQTAKVSKTPAWLQAMGIGDGEWQQITKPQLRALADPERKRGDIPDWVRLWAAGMLATMGYQQEYAVKQISVKDLKPHMEVLRRFPRKEKDGTVTEYALVPKPPIELAREAGIDKSIFGRTMRTVQFHGMGEQTSKVKNEIRLKFFARPLDPKDVKPILVDSPVDQNLPPLNRITVSLTSRWRKKFFPRLKTGSLFLRPDLVDSPVYQKRIESGFEKLYEEVVNPEAQKVVERVNQEFAEGSATDDQMVNGDRSAYKEERNSKRNRDLKEQSSIPEQSRSIDGIHPSPASKTRKQTTTFQEVADYLHSFAKDVGREANAKQVRDITEALHGRPVTDLKRRCDYFQEQRDLTITGYGIFVRMAEECGQPLPLTRAERSAREYQDNLAIIESAKAAERKGKPK